MLQLDLTAENLISSLLRLSETETVCILDSCGIGNLGSHLLIAGIDPVEMIEISNNDPERTLALIEEKFAEDLACIFTISYGLGPKLHRISSAPKISWPSKEPDLFLARFDVLIIHDYDTGETKLVGNTAKFESLADTIIANISNCRSEISNSRSQVTSNFTKTQYLAAIETIKERIRRGDTYQTNLTQQLSVKLPDEMMPQQIFYRLRRDHPAPFAAYLRRRDSTVISASPERFLHLSEGMISTSPIKGTRPRGKTADEDAKLCVELLTSEKDRAENTMIVDLLRNDLGRVCEYGSVRVEKLCDLEEHPTLFHLVSTVTGCLKPGTKFSEILRAVFPCGSITGAPKISTMRIIEEIETEQRGLSMGAIGYFLPRDTFGFAETLDMSVAIRTMVVIERTATFNVGGGIVIDSYPESEYSESLTKAKALLSAIGTEEIESEITNC